MTIQEQIQRLEEEAKEEHERLERTRPEMASANEAPSDIPEMRGMQGENAPVELMDAGLKTQSYDNISEEEAKDLLMGDDGPDWKKIALLTALNGVGAYAAKALGGEKDGAYAAKASMGALSTAIEQGTAKRGKQKEKYLDFLKQKSKQAQDMEDRQWREVVEADTLKRQNRLDERQELIDAETMKGKQYTQEMKEIQAVAENYAHMSQEEWDSLSATLDPKNPVIGATNTKRLEIREKEATIAARNATASASRSKNDPKHDDIKYTKTQDDARKKLADVLATSKKFEDRYNGPEWVERSATFDDVLLGSQNQEQNIQTNKGSVGSKSTPNVSYILQNAEKEHIEMAFKMTNLNKRSYTDTQNNRQNVSLPWLVPHHYTSGIAPNLAPKTLDTATTGRDSTVVTPETATTDTTMTGAGTLQTAPPDTSQANMPVVTPEADSTLTGQQLPEPVADPKEEEAQFTALAEEIGEEALTKTFNALIAEGADPTTITAEMVRQRTLPPTETLGGGQQQIPEQPPEGQSPLDQNTDLSGVPQQGMVDAPQRPSPLQLPEQPHQWDLTGGHVPEMTGAGMSPGGEQPVTPTEQQDPKEEHDKRYEETKERIVSVGDRGARWEKDKAKMLERFKSFSEWMNTPFESLSSVIRGEVDNTIPEDVQQAEQKSMAQMMGTESPEKYIEAKISESIGDMNIEKLDTRDPQQAIEAANKIITLLQTVPPEFLVDPESGVTTIKANKKVIRLFRAVSMSPEAMREIEKHKLVYPVFGAIMDQYNANRVMPDNKQLTSR